MPRYKYSQADRQRVIEEFNRNPSRPEKDIAAALDYPISFITKTMTQYWAMKMAGRVDVKGIGQ